MVRIGDAWTTFRGRRLKVHRTRRPDGGAARPLAPGRFDGALVGTGDGALELVEVQPEGKGRVAAADWLRGARPGPDDLLGA